jgi:cell division protein FtsI/penicillin-binding protein 2
MRGSPMYAPYDNPEIVVIAFAYNGGEVLRGVANCCKSS